MSALDPELVAQARASQAAWARQPLARRAEHIRALGKVFARRGDEVAEVVVAETKKSAGDAWFADVLPNLELFDWWGGAAGQATLAPEPQAMSRLKLPKKRATIYYEPRGVIGLITPWNYPAALPLRTMVPALLAGNAVLLKPSEVTPRTGALLGEIFAEVLPAGLVTVVQGAREAGEAVVDAADHVVFVGSVATGRKVAVRCAEQLKTVSLELGGKDAAVVFADADLERAAHGVVWGAVSNSGQNCASVERVYVEQAVYEPFLARVRDLAARAGVAPVATDAQDAIVRRHLDDAVARGAKTSGAYPGAVVLTDVPADAEVLNDETFGPLLPVTPVPDAAAGIAAANASRYGLTMSLWTRDLDRAERLAQDARAGVVTVNNVAFTGALPFAPWSGRGESGHGVTNGHLAMRELTQPKLVLVDENDAPEAWWHPMSEQAVQLARDTVGWLAATGLDKLGRTVGVLRGMKQRVAEQKRWLAGK
ncbi:MAG: aldehyde dehydrogenase family protein [Myxococcales bacterium]|nr:aldehyde dehydrogenase family protein [Myxococcales bacterium]MCB9734307.1 aldehyde dehydrogenase family protein [Deltaproteobacteria bacterium]